MAALQEHYNDADGADDAEFTCHNTAWGTETFTPVETHDIELVRIKCYKVNSPGDVAVKIQGTDLEDKPDGVDITSGSIAEGDLPTEAGWVACSIIKETLTLGELYAIVVYCPGGDGANNVKWRRKNTTNPYPRGQEGQSFNSGGTWAMYDHDHKFEEYGDPPAVGWSGKVSGVTNPAAVMGVPKLNIAKVKGVVSA